MQEKLIEIVSEKLEGNISRRTIQNDIKYNQESIEADLGITIDFDKYPVFQKGKQMAIKKH